MSRVDLIGAIVLGTLLNLGFATSSGIGACVTCNNECERFECYATKQANGLWQFRQFGTTAQNGPDGAALAKKHANWCSPLGGGLLLQDPTKIYLYYIDSGIKACNETGGNVYAIFCETGLNPQLGNNGNGIPKDECFVAGPYGP